MAFSLTAFSQDKSMLKGKVLDYANHPISFATVSVDSNASILTDFEGEFKLEVELNSASQVLIIAQPFKQKVIPITSEDLIIRLERDTFDVEVEININGKPKDTSYFNNGNIEKIIHQFNQERSFYESGKLKMIKTDQGSRSFSEKGQLIYQSISHNPHVNSITEWYENGNLKAHGTTIWKYNKKMNEGNWENSIDWIYWNNKGVK